VLHYLDIWYIKLGTASMWMTQGFQILTYSLLGAAGLGVTTLLVILIIRLVNQTWLDPDCRMDQAVDLTEVARKWRRAARSASEGSSSLAHRAKVKARGSGHSLF
jgi:hypothetical protein